MSTRLSMAVFKEEVAAEAAAKGRKLTMAERAARLGGIQRRRAIGEFADHDLLEPFDDEARDLLIAQTREDAAAAFIVASAIERRVALLQWMMGVIGVLLLVILWNVA